MSVLVLLVSCQQTSTQTEVADKAPTEKSVALPLCTADYWGSSVKQVDNLAIPQKRASIGNAHIAISTTSVEAQAWFDQGLNLLHDFWHIEAYRVFKEVIKADPTCAMGYWGIAMCQPGFGGDDNSTWEKAIDKAKSLQSNSSQFEQALIGATEVLVKQGVNKAAPIFKELIAKYPNEPEAVAFTSIILRQNVRVGDTASSDEVKSLLEKGMKKFPTHAGILHYYIHVMEVRPDFIKVKNIAQSIAATAPKASHIVHMPGHIYFLEGNYAKAIEVFEKARALELSYHKDDKIPFAADQNYMHNLHYLAVAYSEQGDKEKALAMAQQYANITLSQDAPQDGSALMLLYEGRILPALVHIRFRDFEKADEKLSFWLNSLDVPLTNELVRTYLQAMQAYCRGMSAIQRKDITTAIEQGGILTQLMKSFEQMGVQKQNSSEFAEINQVFDIMSMSRYELAGWIDNIDPKQPFNNAAWAEALDLEALIPYDEPPRLMYPIGESLARLRMYRGEKAEAINASKKALQKRPQSKFIKSIVG